MSSKHLTEMGIDSGDEPVCNHSGNPHFATIVEQRISRRQMLTGSLGAAVAGMFGVASFAPAHASNPAWLPPSAHGHPPFALNPTLSFSAIPPTRSDTTTLPVGYSAQVLIPWGTPITGIYPAFDPSGNNTGAEQEQQVGMHHDGMHFFPFPHESNSHGLLCVNHEYVDQNVLHANGPSAAPRLADEVRKEVAAHGVSIVEIRKMRRNGPWEVVRGRYNRRITAATPMDLTGPVRSSELVRTKYSPEGRRTRGTINNCAHGVTPWNTYLTCEENWSGYFVNTTGLPREHSRYGVSTRNGRYRWETAQGGEDQYLRFNASASGADPTLDYRNEPNTMGWVVEIDPFDPRGVPKKRTALGRFAHEGAWVAPVQIGQPIVVYMGDDAVNEYIYKFVSTARYHKGMHCGDVLDEGTLYVARFNEDGSGNWLALDLRDQDFVNAVAAAGVTFRDQADVLVNTRLAADVAGATKMDRPEWGAVHPQTREVYMTLTNNSGRSASATDAMNPRGPNPYGHIIRWRERGNRSWANAFEWDLFTLAGPETDSQVLPDEGGPALTQDNIFASPDGLWIDQHGILWIQTDMSGSQQASGPFGANQMLAANPRTGEIKRFLAGPFDQECTGVVSTPDGRNLFVNFQHPGDRSLPGQFTSNWPDSGAIFRQPGDSIVAVDPAGARPRSATIVVTRDDGRIVGQ